MIEELENWIKEEISVAVKNLDEWKNHRKYYFAGRLESLREVLDYLQNK